jgi:hypothetical protein
LLVGKAKPWLHSGSALRGLVDNPSAENLKKSEDRSEATDPNQVGEEKVTSFETKVVTLRQEDNGSLHVYDKQALPILQMDGGKGRVNLPKRTPLSQ